MPCVAHSNFGAGVNRYVSRTGRRSRRFPSWQNWEGGDLSVTVANGGRGVAGSVEEVRGVGCSR